MVRNLIAILLSLIVLSVYSQELAATQLTAEHDKKANQSSDILEQQKGTNLVPFGQNNIAAGKTSARPEQDHSSKSEHSENESKLATWTVVLGIATVILALIGIGQLYMFWSQLRLMRKAIGDGTIAANAAKDSAEIAREALLKTERAFVFLDGFTYELTTAADSKNEDENLPEFYRNRRELFITRFAVQPKWKNGGNTPTRKMTIRIDWRGPLGPVPPDYVYRNPQEEFFLAPKASEPCMYIEMPGAQALIEYEMNHNGDKPMMFIWGRADYEDIFGQSHFVEWCRQVRFECHKGGKLGADFIHYGAYNRTDNEIDA